MFRRLSIALLTTTLAVPAFAADDPTSSSLDARKVSGTIVVTPVTGGTATTLAAPYRYKAEHDRTWRPLRTGQVILASDSVSVNLFEANPLEAQVSVKSKKTPNVGSGQLADFMKSLLAFPKAIGAPQAANEGCPAVLNHIDALWSALRAGTTNADVIRLARQDFKNEHGADAARKASGRLDDQSAFLKKSAKDAQEQLDAINAFLSGATQPAPATPAVPTPSLPAAAGGRGAPPVAVPPTAAPRGGQGVAAGQATPAQPTTQVAPSSGCSTEQLTRRFAELAIIGSAQDGIKLLQDQIKALDGLKNTLKPYTDDARWDGDDYLIYASSQTADEDDNATVEVTKLTYDVTVTTLSATAGDPTSVTVVFRDYSALVPETAAGLIVSRVLASEYGTSKNASGQTVVAPPTKKQLSFSGAVVLNAVCRCGMRAFAYPMLQLGVSTDTSNLGLLIGTGLRFIRPSRFALSAGAIVAWINDLNQLSVGSVINGSADIQADLKRKVVVKPYLGLLYKF